MKTVITFISGTAMGILITLLSTGSCGENEPSAQPHPTHFSVNAGAACHTLHLGMTADSVKMLMGQPSHTSSETLGGTLVQTWSYPNGSGQECTLTFNNHRLCEATGMCSVKY